MSARRRPAAPPPTPEERAEARAFLPLLRYFIANPDACGKATIAHIDMTRPRRGLWLKTWATLPGFSLIVGDGYQHRLLPGWVYLDTELADEMLPDLEALAERGVRPTEATR
jgi:hypothetical protein